MKASIKKLGKITSADIEMGKLTIVCGSNNTGKSYIAYSIYSFLKTIGDNITFQVHDSDFQEFIKIGRCSCDMNEYWEDYEKAISAQLPLFSATIPRFLALSPGKGKECCFIASDFMEFKESFYKTFFIYGYAIGNKYILRFSKDENSYMISCSLENNTSEFPEKEKLKTVFSDYLSKVVNASLFPKIVCMTGERSGVSIFASPYLTKATSDFKNEKDFKEINSSNASAFPYALPVMEEISFFMQLNKIKKSPSFIGDNSAILKFFDSLAGGSYDYDELNGISYLPKGESKPLSLYESSSSVKSLVELNFYLRNVFTSRHILMIDEPELNLHPENQRKLARLLAMLVNEGIQVFVTTHSDYIIREFNTLIMLNSNRKKNLKKIALELGYDKKHANCLLSPEDARCYVVKDGTAHPMDVNSAMGIEVTSFDDTIDEVNALQQRIMFGGN